MDKLNLVGTIKLHASFNICYIDTIHPGLNCAKSLLQTLKDLLAWLFRARTIPVNLVSHLSRSSHSIQTLLHGPQLSTHPLNLP